PILDRYMKGRPSFGVYQPRNLGLYTYTWNRPTTLQDPDGRAVFIPFLALAAGGGVVSGGVEALRQWSAGENVNWCKRGIAAAGGEAWTGARMLKGGAGAAPLYAGPVGGGPSAFSSRLGHDLYDGEGVLVDCLVQDTFTGAVLGGALSWGAYKLLPK